MLRFSAFGPAVPCAAPLRAAKASPAAGDLAVLWFRLPCLRSSRPLFSLLTLCSSLSLNASGQPKTDFLPKPPLFPASDLTLHKSPPDVNSSCTRGKSPCIRGPKRGMNLFSDSCPVLFLENPSLHNVIRLRSPDICHNNTGFLYPSPVSPPSRRKASPPPRPPISPPASPGCDFPLLQGRNPI